MPSPGVGVGCGEGPGIGTGVGGGIGWTGGVGILSSGSAVDRVNKKVRVMVSPEAMFIS